jgi:hypothetical protein
MVESAAIWRGAWSYSQLKPKNKERKKEISQDGRSKEVDFRGKERSDWMRKRFFVGKRGAEAKGQRPERDRNSLPEGGDLD